MSLDIRIIERKPIICPECGEVAGHVYVRKAESGGRAWYPILEEFDYYRAGDMNLDWYGKNMVLTADQADRLQRFMVQTPLYNKSAALEVITSAICDGNDVIINADW